MLFYKKRGVSTVVATVLLVAMTVVLVSVLWIFLSNIIQRHEDIAKIIVLNARVDHQRKNYTIYIVKMPSVVVLVENLAYQVVNQAGEIFSPTSITLYNKTSSIKSSGPLESTDYWIMSYNSTYVEFRIYGPNAVQGTVRLDKL